MKKICFLVLVGFFLLGTIQPLYSLGKILFSGQLFDYNFTYLRAASAFLEGKNIYSFGDINYPSTALFIFIPLSFLPIYSGQIIFTLVSLICLVLSVIFITKSLNWKLNLNETLLIFPLIFLSFPSKWTLGLGQLNNLVLLFVVLNFYFFKKQKYWFSGFFLGWAMALKLIPGLLVIYFLLKKEFKVVFTSLISFFLILLTAGFIFGFNLIFEYFFKVIPSILGQPNKNIYYNQAFSGFIARILNTGNSQVSLSLIFLVLVLLITFFVLMKGKKIRAVEYATVISTVLLISPFSWQHHFVWLVFPFLILFFVIKKENYRGIKCLVVIAYLLIAFNIKRPGNLPTNFIGNLLLSHVFLGNFILWTILLYFSRYHKGND